MPINYILIFGQSVGYILMPVRVAVRGSARAGAISIIDKSSARKNFDYLVSVYHPKICNILLLKWLRN